MAAQPEPWKSLRAMLEAFGERLKRLENSSTFFNSGMTVTGPNEFEIDGSVTVTGDFTADGKIKNDALTDPVKPQVVKVSASNFSLTVPFVEKAGVDVTVPTGFTELAIVMSGRMYAINPNTTGGADTTGTDALYVRVSIGGNQSISTPTGVSGSNGFATTISFDAFDLTGLTPGSTLRFSVEGATAYQTFAANAANYITATAQLIWLR